MPDIPEHELIDRAQRGDSDAVAGLYRQYVQAITRYISYRVGDSAVVEDLTAEVFLRMVEGLPDYRPTGAPFEAWLYRIAGARVADHYRAQRRHPTDELPEVLESGGTPLDLRIEQREELDALRAALQQLSEDHQTILILRFVERKSHQEVADILDRSVVAITTAQYRALKRLAELLGTDKNTRHYLRGTSNEPPSSR